MVFVFHANVQFYVGSCHGSIHASKVEATTSIRFKGTSNSSTTHDLIFSYAYIRSQSFMRFPTIFYI